MENSFPWDNEGALEKCRKLRGTFRLFQCSLGNSDRFLLELWAKRVFENCAKGKELTDSKLPCLQASVAKLGQLRPIRTVCSELLKPIVTVLHHELWTI